MPKKISDLTEFRVIMPVPCILKHDFCDTHEGIVTL